MRAGAVRRFCGREFSAQELSRIQEVVASSEGGSRWELAQRVCERLDWRRPSGGWKARECRDLLEGLEREGWFVLPAKRTGRPRGSRTRVPVSEAGEPGALLAGRLRDFGPLVLKLVSDVRSQRWFRELVGRYHPLSYRVAFGAPLRYLAFVSKPEERVVGAVQFSSPAWRIAVRDGWIGWDDSTRQRNLQRVVQNSRFLVLPWVRVSNLASAILSRVVRRVRTDWPRRYGIEPLLLETLLDPRCHRGSCYRAANWIELGQTAGRGRMDRAHRRHGQAPKTVLVYPLVTDARRRLREV